MKGGCEEEITHTKMIDNSHGWAGSLWKKRERKDRQTYLRHVDLESLFCIVEIFVVPVFMRSCFSVSLVKEREEILC